MSLTFEQEQRYNKDLYLVQRLALQTGLLSEEMDLDSSFEFTINLYEEFKDGEFNDREKSSYSCIMDFVTYKLEL